MMCTCVVFSECFIGHDAGTPDNESDFLKESKEMNIEVGKLYKCGDRVVKVMSIVKENTWRGTTAVFALLEDSDGDYCANCLAGVFCLSGSYSPKNDPLLQHYLEEIKEPVKEMTMEQVNEALGFEAKIVEKKGD